MADIISRKRIHLQIDPSLYDALKDVQEMANTNGDEPISLREASRMMGNIWAKMRQMKTPFVVWNMRLDRELMELRKK